MFVQVIRGKVVDGPGLEKQLEKAREELSPGAVGFLGSTAGVSEDGRFIIVARFESKALAEKNNGRPEQDAWWKETEGYVSDVTFENSEDTELFKDGGSDTAGFVQVMTYKLNDRDKARALFDEMMAMSDDRPDMVGSVTIFGDGGKVTDVLYFSSEAEARAGEAKPPSEDTQRIMGEFGKLLVGEVDYLDLREPHLNTP